MLGEDRAILLVVASVPKEVTISDLVLCYDTLIIRRCYRIQSYRQRCFFFAINGSFSAQLKFTEYLHAVHTKLPVHLLTPAVHTTPVFVHTPPVMFIQHILHITSVNT